MLPEREQLSLTTALGTLRGLWFIELVWARFLIIVVLDKAAGAQWC